MSHVDEVLALMEATGFTVHDGHVPTDPSYPYAVLYARTPDRSINSMRHTSGRLDLRFQVTSVGLTGESARIVAQAMQDALLDVTVTVAGWTNYPIRDTPNDQPLREDREVTLTSGRHPMYVINEYLLAAEAA